jgi:uncharacterized protein
MEKIPINIVALANSESQPNSFVVILKEETGDRRLPIVIGGFEAQAIAIAMEGILPNRPLTHDLFRNTLVSLGVEIREVIVSELKGGVFYATMICRQVDGNIVEMDARTSDALAMAVRFGCPIFAYAPVLDEAGVVLEEPASDGAVLESQPLDEISKEQLEKLLHDALADEDYERAAQIRDEIKRRAKE